MSTGLSWFRITLDTTAPSLTMYLPNNTTSESIEEITIVASENLSSRHDIYVIDSLGVKHDFIFALQEDKKTFIGRPSFNAFPHGIATFYVHLYDEVWNKSALYRASINILDPQNVKMYVYEDICKLEMEIVTRPTLVSVKERPLIFNEQIMNNEIYDELEEGE